uniref:Squalene synthase n=1 Tax=Chromera velia CCMP2878 TaxID=1169474 RepID=A0A0G4FWL5_9ALVE|eukprot:Cvel_19145.t1-p1 / transcript=Cvel_19145.t1 / gene=Cvel_19145 / organism=Chromera_velia_CCMP2878 / gene_product=Squalene synthase, putative / transcript_product=Squalene synthase, putative / location=Cvel_scaffold1629:4300-7435(+) / protein_length=463 / sequence_SO=supercontig / SO=protein_coding / is_pseudo=false
MLTKVSRSFAAVILEVHEELRMAICVFYLVLRGLDTIEDDMKIPMEEKLKELEAFPSRLDTPGWNCKGKGYGEGDECSLLENFENVIAVYGKLKEPYRGVIQRACAEMSEGMREFLQNSGTPEKIEDYDRYCYFVAGLVGTGLTELFDLSGMVWNDARSQQSQSQGQQRKGGSSVRQKEKGQSAGAVPSVDAQERRRLAISMGLFLQKTNIIRDYREDIEETPPRQFWPREIWGKYVRKFELMRDPAHAPTSLRCLDAMVADALRHVPDCLQYLSMIGEPSIFRFCAIPQVMAISTLERCLHNRDIFLSPEPVKIRKGEAAKLILRSGDMKGAEGSFDFYLSVMRRRAEALLETAAMEEEEEEDEASSGHVGDERDAGVGGTSYRAHYSSETRHTGPGASSRPTSAGCSCNQMPSHCPACLPDDFPTNTKTEAIQVLKALDRAQAAVALHRARGNSDWQRAGR